MKKIITIFISIILLILIIDLLLYKNNNEYTKYKHSLDKVIEDNNYEVISINKSIDIINKESGLLFFGTNDDLDYAILLNDISKDFNIDKIYYINLTNDKNNYKVKSSLENNIKIENDLIITPFLLTVKDGELKNITIFDDYNGLKLDKRLYKILTSYNYNKNSINN